MPATRTVNPLHFEDLEPHRFEDLVRQLAYAFRQWAQLEATGRSGSDQGADIRGIERIPAPEARKASDDVDPEEEESDSFVDRIWIIQCKRERSLPPSRMPAILDASLKPDSPPYGFILAAACDFSAKARDAFRMDLSKRGVQEFYLWGKAELEDLLFQPRNDHLLFAYFGLSLQVRRRSLGSLSSRRLTIKRRLIKVCGDINSVQPISVLLRDAEDPEYPYPSNEKAFLEDPTWRYFRFAGHLRPDYAAFVIAERWAWIDFDAKTYDVIAKHDQAYPHHPRLAFGPEHKWTEEEEKARRFWYGKVPQANRATWRRIGLVHYDRIVQVDEIGDRFHEPPHLLIDFALTGQFFDRIRDVIESSDRWNHQILYPADATKKAYFPDPFPDVTDEEFEAGIRTT